MNEETKRIELDWQALMDTCRMAIDHSLEDMEQCVRSIRGASTSFTDSDPDLIRNNGKWLDEECERLAVAVEVRAALQDCPFVDEISIKGAKW